MQTIKLKQLKQVLIPVTLSTSTMYTPHHDYTILIRFDSLIKIIRLEDRDTGLVAIDCNYNSFSVTWDSEVAVEVTYKQEHVFSE